MSLPTPPPFSPEPLPALQARLPAALASTMDPIMLMVDHPERSPSFLPGHIFDREGRDPAHRQRRRYTKGVPLTVLHVSASVVNDVAVWKEAVNNQGYEFLIAAYAAAVRELFDGYPLKFRTAVDSGVSIHYWFEWPVEIPEGETRH